MIGAALDTSSDITKWHLPAGKWETVASLIDTTASAYTTGNVVEFRNATSWLELTSPRRTDLIGTEPTGPPPPPIRDRLNRLIHSLDRTDEKSTEAKDE